MTRAKSDASYCSRDFFIRFMHQRSVERQASQPPPQPVAVAAVCAMSFVLWNCKDNASPSSREVFANV
eukprot:6545914-Lingulodinium_polyedra.AAC.1